MKLVIRVLLKLGILQHLIFNVKSIVQQKQFTIPLQGKMGLENVFLVESWAIQFFSSLLSNCEKGSSFVDIGVNIGQTLIKIRSIDETVNYIGFEPNSTCVSYVNNLIKLNEISKVSIYPLGLSDKDGMLSLFADNAYASGASVIENFRKSAKIAFKLNIPVVKGDNFFKTFEGKIGIVKIDVEGFESSVLTGMEGILTIHKPFIVCEVLPVYNENNLPRLARQKSLEQLLTKLGFSIYQINEQSGTIQKIPEIGIHGDMCRTNYLFCHQSKEMLIKNLIAD